MEGRRANPVADLVMVADGIYGFLGLSAVLEPLAELEQRRIEVDLFCLGVHLEHGRQAVPQDLQRLGIGLIDFVDASEQSALLFMISKDDLCDVHVVSPSQDGRVVRTDPMVTRRRVSEQSGRPYDDVKIAVILTRRRRQSSG